MRKLRYVCSRCQSLTKILLLLGLRVSQFNEEKCGAPSDPTQKTIINFIASGDAHGNGSALLPEVTGHDLVSDTETDLSIGSRQTSFHHSRDPFDGNYSVDAECYSCTVRKYDSADNVISSLSHSAM